MGQAMEIEEREGAVDMTWKNRWPTATEARAHVERHGRGGSGAWLCKYTRDDFPEIRRIAESDDMAMLETEPDDWTACQDTSYLPWLRPIDLDGNPVPWPGGHRMTTPQRAALRETMGELLGWLLRSAIESGNEGLAQKLGPLGEAISTVFDDADACELVRDTIAEAIRWCELEANSKSPGATTAGRILEILQKHRSPSLSR